jgi:hypothetical protein
MDKKLILNSRNLHGRQSRKSSSKSATQLTSASEQTGEIKDQTTNPAPEPIEEAIDVLSFMGFKL